MSAPMQKSVAEACRIDQSRCSAVSTPSVILVHFGGQFGRCGKDQGRFRLITGQSRGPARVELGDPLGPLVAPPIGSVVTLFVVRSISFPLTP